MAKKGLVSYSQTQKCNDHGKREKKVTFRLLLVGGVDPSDTVGGRNPAPVDW